VILTSKKTPLLWSPDPVLLKTVVEKYPDRDILPFPELPEPVIVYLLDMPEFVTGKIFLDELEELDFLREKCILVLLCFAGDSHTLFIQDYSIIFPVPFQSRKLSPVNDPFLVRLTVEHIGVDAADGKPAVINPAPAIFKEPAGTCLIILYPESVPGDIENPVLVAELRPRCRLKGLWFDLPYNFYVPVKEEDVTIEAPGTASGAGCAPEPDLANDSRKTLKRVLI
jgi:hypothetical protein